METLHFLLAINADVNLALSLMINPSSFLPLFLFGVGIKSGFLLTGCPTAASVSEKQNPNEATKSGPHTVPHAHAHTNSDLLLNI